MATLYEISEELSALEAMLTEAGGEIPPEAEAEIDAWLADVQGRRDEKVDNYCRLIRNLETRQAGRVAEAARLDDRARVDANTVSKLKARLLAFFDAHEIKTLDTALFHVTAQNNGGLVPLILKAGPEEMPAEFVEVVETRKPATAAIRAALEAGHALPFAELGPRGRGLRIK